MRVRIVKNTFPQLRNNLLYAEQHLQEFGREFAEDAARFMEVEYRGNLTHQGRPGGNPPPLSPVTEHLYNQVGWPDGEGIRNHISITYAHEGMNSRAILGVAAGKPTTVAKVQDRGATIPVTDAMRGFLARHGIFLRADTTHITIPPRRSWELALGATDAYAKRKLGKFWALFRRFPVGD